MPLKAHPCALSALFLLGAAAAVAQTTVYRCESAGTVTYSEKACASGRVVDTKEAPVPARRSPKLDENQAMAQAMTPRAGESAEQFETRRRRARLTAEDRDECARLDKRMPVEQGSLANPDPDEAAQAQEALSRSRKRFAELKC